MKRITLFAVSLAVVAASFGGGANAAGRASLAAATFAEPDAQEEVAQGDMQTYIFKDVLKPHGKARGAAEKQADARACGASWENDLPSNIPTFEKCMRARGWKFDHIVTTYAPEPQVEPGSVGTWTYNDVLKPHGRERGEAEEQLATRVCDGGDSDRIGSAQFRSCMNKRGWRLSQFDPTPSASDDNDASVDTPPTYDSTADNTQQMLNDERATQQANDAAQQMVNDAAAAATQALANAVVAQP
jgi:hypothetical protein